MHRGDIGLNKERGYPYANNRWRKALSFKE